MQIIYQSLANLLRQLEKRDFLKGKDAVMLEVGTEKLNLTAFGVAQGSVFQKNQRVLKKILTGKYICLVLGQKKIKVYYGITNHLISSIYAKKEEFSMEGFLQKVLQDLFNKRYV